MKYESKISGQHNLCKQISLKEHRPRSTIISLISIKHQPEKNARADNIFFFGYKQIIFMTTENRYKQLLTLLIVQLHNLQCKGQ